MTNEERIKKEMLTTEVLARYLVSYNDDWGAYYTNDGTSFYHRSEAIIPMQDVDLERISDLVGENIRINIVDLANRYPDTKFILFYTPYSALYWESIYRDGTLDRQLECERIATELMLECDNIILFNFCHISISFKNDH